jgi:hypothetical protein
MRPVWLAFASRHPAGRDAVIGQGRMDRATLRHAAAILEGESPFDA